jgi:CheY-like chemotaxis protein
MGLFDLQEALAAQGKGPALRVLMVDDDELILATAPALLERMGHWALTAARGEEALALLQGRDVDLVILDYTMPGLSGVETAARIRALWPGLPILLATGHPDAQVEDFAARTPGVGILYKPYTLTELGRHFSRVSGNGASARR